MSAVAEGRLQALGVAGCGGNWVGDQQHRGHETALYPRSIYAFQVALTRESNRSCSPFTHFAKWRERERQQQEPEE